MHNIKSEGTLSLGAGEGGGRGRGGWLEHLPYLGVAGWVMLHLSC